MNSQSAARALEFPTAQDLPTYDHPITYRGTVYQWQCDHMGHMSVMWYVAKFNDATWELISSLGLTRERLASEQIGMAALEQHIKYKRELYAGDVITVRSSVLDVREKSATITHEMKNEQTGEVAATTVIVGVHFDLRTRKPLPFPTDVRERATRMMESNRALTSCRVIEMLATQTEPRATVPSHDTEAS
jgi:acyl-CoA thioester hydrolase